MSTILVIEDEPDVRANLSEILDAEGYEVIEAADGRVGVNLAREQLPDMVLCDIRMPDLDGYDVLDALRADPATAMVPFVFLTARADRVDVRQGMNRGADDYLTKPFTRDDLLQAVHMRLGKEAAIARRVQNKLDALRGSITQALPHEFRTPLTSILGYAEILLDDYAALLPAEVHRMLEDMHTAAQRLHLLVVRFLMYAELQGAARDRQHIDAVLGVDEHPLKDIASQAALTQARLAGREADLILDLQPAEIQLSAQYVDKVVQELASNAFKFSEAGQPVRVVGCLEGERYILSVHDRGRGMTAEQIVDIGAYLQFDRQHYEQQGPGLGLGIAKCVADLQGGELRIESIPGQQTVVSLILPLTRSPAAVPANTPVEGS